MADRQEEPATQAEAHSDHPPITEAGLAMIRDCAAWGIDPALAATSVVAIEEQAREEGYNAANYIRDALEETEPEHEARVPAPLDVPTRHDFRLVLWLHHGHDGLYGDDGEMQCNRYPPVDFRRDHIDSLIGHIGWTQISALSNQPSTEPAHLGFCVKVKARDMSVECNCGVAGFPSTEPAQRDDCICPDDAGAHPECPYHNATEPAQGGTE